MPHIEPRKREKLANFDPTCMGDLAYIIAREIDLYVGAPETGFRFQRIGEVLGALESVRAEFIERVHKPYEDHKAMQNGTAFPRAEKRISEMTLF
jgi:hypothetical protein